MKWKDVFIRNKSIIIHYCNFKPLFLPKIQIHNKSPSLLSSHIRIHWTIMDCLICAYFSLDSDKMPFSAEKAILWIEDLYELQNILMDLFLTNTAFRLRCQLMDGSRVSCRLLWCFYPLFGLILTAPIHCRVFIGEQVMQC